MHAIPLILATNATWYLTLCVLGLSMLVGIIWTVRVMNDIKDRSSVDVGADSREILSPLAQAFAAGQMSKEEYRRIQESFNRSEAGASRAASDVVRHTPPELHPKHKSVEIDPGEYPSTESTL